MLASPRSDCSTHDDVRRLTVEVNATRGAVPGDAIHELFAAAAAAAAPSRAAVVDEAGHVTYASSTPAPTSLRTVCVAPASAPTASSVSAPTDRST